MTITLTKMIIPGPKDIFENPLPRFRDKEKNREIKSNGSLTPEENNETLGRDTGSRVLPYRMQDVYSRARDAVERDVIVMENEYIKAVFFPWHGGKLYSLTDKVRNRPILFTNPVFQPANLAIRDAWTSGGVEWNVSQLGHTFSTASPMFFMKMEKEGEAPFLRMYDYERQKNLFWSIDFHLPDGAKELTAHVRIVNDDDFVKPMYWWTNTAVIETEDARVFSETDEVFYQDWIEKEEDGKIRYIANGFGHAKMPHYKDADGIEHAKYDASFSMQIPRSSEYFFQNPKTAPYPWEAVTYKDGYMFFEKSTQPLRFRKMFCWGKGRGGRFWCDFLSEPGQGDYIELQAGLAPSQVHGYQIDAESTIRFTQSFSCLEAEDVTKLYGDWHEGRDYAKKQVCNVISDEEMAEIDARAEKLWKEAKPAELLYKGTGWGALEKKRREKIGKNLPFGFDFPDSSIEKQQEIWLNLLNTGSLGDGEADSFIVADEWREMLSKDTSDLGKLLMGVMEMESGNLDQAEELWKAVSNEKYLPMALRNLSQLELRKENEEAALALMKKACDEGKGKLDPAYIREYIQMLVRAKKFNEAWDAFENAPESTKTDDRSRLIVGSAAIEIGQYAYLDILFEESHATIREGETSLTDLWFRREAAREAEKRGVEVDDKLIQEMRDTKTPPRSIDFRMS
ncbi:MAG: DUF5107 domain-containing protein [Clostridia bacterium]|nr:DUF5107 domain-containing protein [Clostridia bacterium]